MNLEHAKKCVADRIKILKKRKIINNLNNLVEDIDTYEETLDMTSKEGKYLKITMIFQ